MRPPGEGRLSAEPVSRNGFVSQVVRTDRVFTKRGFDRLGIALPEIGLTLDRSSFAWRFARTTKASLEGVEHRLVSSTKVRQETQQPVFFVLSGEGFGEIGGVIDGPAQGLGQEV